MSTRGLIGVECRDDTIGVAYIHNDSNPEHVGAILNRIKDTDTVKDLISLGSLSSLNHISNIKPEAFRFKNEKITEDIVARYHTHTPPSFYHNHEQFLYPFVHDDYNGDIEYVYLFVPYIDEPNHGDWLIVDVKEKETYCLASLESRFKDFNNRYFS